jgi:hypothetical protein
LKKAEELPGRRKEEFDDPGSSAFVVQEAEIDLAVIFFSGKNRCK